MDGDDGKEVEVSSIVMSKGFTNYLLLDVNIYPNSVWSTIKYGHICGRFGVQKHSTPSSQPQRRFMPLKNQSHQKPQMHKSSRSRNSPLKRPRACTAHTPSPSSAPDCSSDVDSPGDTPPPAAAAHTPAPPSTGSQPSDTDAARPGISSSRIRLRCRCTP